MKSLARMRLVESRPNDDGITLEAFATYWLANEVVVVRDLSDGYGTGMNASVDKPVDSPAFVESAKGSGVFRALINYPPLGSEMTEHLK